MLPKLFAIVVIITVLSIGVSVFYYFVIYTPKKLEYQKQQTISLDICLKDAQTAYNQFWDRECNGLGYKAKCRLGKDLSDRVDGQLESDKADCYKKYQPEKSK